MSLIISQKNESKIKKLIYEIGSLMRQKIFEKDANFYTNKKKMLNEEKHDTQQYFIMIYIEQCVLCRS